MIKYIKGDLLALAKEGEFDVVVLPCNCFCDQKSDLTKNVHKAFKESFIADKETEVGDVYKLGSYTYASIKSLRFVIVNLYVQYEPGPNKFEHAAFGLGIRNLASALDGNEIIAMPQIGIGGAGGSWKAIETIIKKELQSFDVQIIQT